MTVTNPKCAALPAIGTRATYHGSLTDSHGRDFLVFPHDFLLSTDEAEDCGCDHRSRRTLVSCDLAADPLVHVRESSFTAETGDWWPDDAIDIVHGGFVYKASHTLPGGSPTTRVLAFYTGSGQVLKTWGTLCEITNSNTIRVLDERGLDSFRARLALPSPLNS
ncbi:hypothetical protein ABZ604_31495 [Streptomyces sp. NPDC012473]|uniref:hypothetical protein n=1 Tax=Streptomyces sp. NPDC012473 TaxID=3156676 RepID=UPI0033C0FBE8